jgi:protein TonB
MTRSRARWILPALVVSLLVNCALLGLASLLSSEQSLPQDITEPVAVRLVEFSPPERAREKKVNEWRKPEPRTTLDFIPDLVTPQPYAASMPAIALAIDPRLLGSPGWGGDLIFDIDDLDQPPQAIVRVSPVYPYEARQREIEGYARVKFLVTADGRVSRVSILDASPPGLFEETVLKTVPTWKFSPGKISGKSVAAWVLTTIRFELT